MNNDDKTIMSETDIKFSIFFIWLVKFDCKKKT